MSLDERGRLLRERFKARRPAPHVAFVAPVPTPPPAYLPRAESEDGKHYYLPRKNGPSQIVKWVQEPDPEPPLLKVRLPQSPLIAMARRAFEKWQNRQIAGWRLMVGSTQQVDERRLTRLCNQSQSDGSVELMAP